MSRKESVIIIVLLSKEQLEKGKYVMSIDVVQKKKADSHIKVRAKDGFELSACLMSTGKSPVLEVYLKEGKCPINFDVSGALKPVHKPMEGENVLNFTGKVECQKITTLCRNTEDSTAMANITFTHAGTYLHRVNIDDVPLPSGRAGVEDRLQSALTVSGAAAGQAAEHVVSDVGDGSLGPGNQALPIPPRPTSVTVVPPSSPGDFNSGSAEDAGSDEGDNDAESRHRRDEPDGARRDEPDGAKGDKPTRPRRDEPDGPRGNEPTRPRTDEPGGARREEPDVPHVMHPSLSTSSFRDISAKGKILNDESLNALAAALSPQDANRLVASLGIPDAIVKQARGNNTNDVVEQQFELLKHWRHRNADRGTDVRYATLVQELGTMGRNDIKQAIADAVENNRNLTRQDLRL